jgi:hypothetical protein
VNLLIVVVAAIVLGILSPDVGSAQAPYTFTVIAESSPCVFCEGFLPGLAINSRGTVAFRGCFGTDPERRCGIYTGRGGALTLIAGLRAIPGLGIVANGPFGASGVPSINASGVVAFAGWHETLGFGVFTGSGGPIAQVVDPRVDFRSVLSEGPGPGISSDGDLAFTGCLQTGECGILVTRSGRLDLLAAVGPFSMNANGLVAFLRYGVGGATAQVFTSNRHGRLSLIGDIFTPPGLTVFDVPAISPHGVVSIISCFQPGCKDGWGIFTDRAGEPPTLVVDTRTFRGPVLASAIDGDGTVAFFGCRGAGFGRCGIYTGLDSVADVVVQEGAALLGSMVRNLCCFGPPFVFALDNEMLSRGRIVFAAGLGDGRSVIVRADPVRHESLESDEPEQQERRDPRSQFWTRRTVTDTGQP